MLLQQHGRTNHVCCHYGNTEWQHWIAKYCKKTCRHYSKCSKWRRQILTTISNSANWKLGIHTRVFFKAFAGKLVSWTWEHGKDMQRPTSKLADTAGWLLPLPHPLTPSLKPQGSQDQFAVRLCLSMLTLGCRSHVKHSGPSTSDCRQNCKNFPSPWQDRSASSPHASRDLNLKMDVAQPESNQRNLSLWFGAAKQVYWSMLERWADLNEGMKPNLFHPFSNKAQPRCMQNDSDMTSHVKIKSYSGDQLYLVLSTASKKGNHQ